MVTVPQIRSALWSAWPPIVVLFTYKIISLICGYFFTPTPVTLVVLELVYWLLYASIGWYAGKSGFTNFALVATIGLIVYVTDLVILVVYFWLPSPSTSSLVYAIRTVGVGGWYLPGLIGLTVAGALLGRRFGSVRTSAGA